MGFAELTDNKYVLSSLTFVSGVVAAITAQQILGRRGLFTYFVQHSRVGVSASDQVLGEVRVTWNGNPVRNLYHSTLELTNQSFKDFQNLAITIYTADTRLLSQHTSIVGTPDIVQFAPAYMETLRVAEGQQPTQQQFDTYNRRREYVVPVLNRGQTLRFNLLNVADGDASPTIWLHASHPGVKVRFHRAPDLFWGVPRSHAALAGLVAGAVLLIVLLAQVKVSWIVGISAFTYGIFVLIPGALLVQSWRWLRGWYGG
jgi:hypothetical protein